MALFSARSTDFAHQISHAFDGIYHLSHGDTCLIDQGVALLDALHACIRTKKIAMQTPPPGGVLPTQTSSLINRSHQ